MTKGKKTRRPDKEDPVDQPGQGNQSDEGGTRGPGFADIDEGGTRGPGFADIDDGEGTGIGFDRPIP